LDEGRSPNCAPVGRQLCIVSCQGSGIAYYWSVIDGRFRNAVGFRGFSVSFQGATVARELMDFTVQGPLIDCLSDLQDLSQLQEIQMGGSAGPPSGGPPQVPFDAKIRVAPAPQVAPGGRNPHGAVLLVTNEREGATVATVADFHRDEDWVFALLAAAIAAVAVNGGAPLIEALMFGNSLGNLKTTITTPIGTVVVNKPFTASAGLNVAV
jgi:hypothetical protein